MTQHVLTLNAGSATLKFALFAAADDLLSCLASGLVEMTGRQRHIVAHDGDGKPAHEAAWSNDDAPFHADALQRIFHWRLDTLPDVKVSAVGHRVVHGGVHHAAPAIVADDVLRDLRELVPLAPLHQPHNIAGILAVRDAWPDMVQVACFDTAFHRAHPFVNDVFALPRRFFEAGVRRHGFQGLSYEYVAGRMRQIVPHHAAGRVEAAHLGDDASATAGRWQVPWASPHWTVCRWERAAASSIPAWCCI